MDSLAQSQATDVFRAVSQNIEKVMVGQKRAVRLLLAAMAGGGHVLLEDYPGTGKTTLAKALAKSVDVEFSRVQFTPDLLPSDILGVSVYDLREKAFRFHKGPVFTNILLVDEINRASPRTQSALLEAMAESQVSLDNMRRPLDELFFVIATQNPVESAGTYPLPEAQMDRFALRFGLGYVSAGEEMEVLSGRQEADPVEHLRPVVSRETVLGLRARVRGARITEEVKRYIVEIVRATREAKGVELGASPRASLALMKTAQALALYDGMDFVTPDHARELAEPVLAHRLVLDPEALFSGRTPGAVVQEILARVPAPA
jgi:MoxR-like ATPase